MRPDRLRPTVFLVALGISCAAGLVIAGDAAPQSSSALSRAGASRLRQGDGEARQSAGATAAAPADSQRAAADAPTFSRDVAPIFYNRCVSCHRPGELAPMSLITYSDVRPWASAIREKVTTRVMPPWHADPQYGSFRNDLSLTQREIDTIAAWAGAGAREGNP